MTQCLRFAFWIGVSIALFPSPVLANSQRDGTTPTVFEGCSGGPNCIRITGGTLRDRNLFHSFSNFSVEAEQRVEFDGRAVSNIFSRVTGGDPSRIDGTLAVDGNANLFLLNPQGVIFGADARLDIGGSFLATTADAIEFDEGSFLASSAQTEIPLLRVPTSVLFVNQITRQQAISIESGASLEVSQGQSLLLIGASPDANGIAIDGSNLEARGGRIELAAIGAPGAVGLTVDDNQFRIDSNVFPATARADILFTNSTEADVAAAGGGNITVFADDLVLQDNSNLLAGINSGEVLDAQAGDVEIDATGEVRLLDGSTIENSVESATGRSGNILITANGVVAIGQGNEVGSSGIRNRVEVGSTGQGGRIRIQTGSLELREGAVITNSMQGTGESGNIVILADTVILDGKAETPRGGFRQTSGLFNAVTGTGVGQAGTIRVTTGLLRVTNGGAIITVTLGQGRAGNVTVNANRIVLTGIDQQSVIEGSSDFVASGIYSGPDEGAIGQGGDILLQTDTLLVRDGATINAESLGEGNAGTLTIRARESARVIGASAEADRFESSLNFNTSTSSDAGTLDVQTPRLVIRAGGQVSATTSSSGRGGLITIRAPNTVEILGTSADGNPSRLRFATNGSGNARGIRIVTGELSVGDRGTATVSSEGAGNPGTLVVVADSIDLRNQAELSATSGAGNGGNIQLQVDGEITLRDGSSINTSAQATGGDITLTADALSLSDGGAVTTDTQGSQGGEINIQVNDQVILRRRSLISTSAPGTGNGGNIEIEAPNGFVLAVLAEDSDVVAGANEGDGGRAEAEAIGVFGFREFNGERTPDSDFTADSVSGIPGIVFIETEDREFPELPDPTFAPQIARGCDARGDRVQSEFVVTGSAGSPASSDQDSSGVWEDLRPLEAAPTTDRSTIPATQSREPIVEAQGWIRSNDGEIILIAQAPTVSPQSPQATTIDCPTP